jgi:hypothetical protein
MFREGGVTAFGSWDVLHFFQLAPEGARRVLASGRPARPVGAGATKHRGGHQRIAGSRHMDDELHGMTPSAGTKKQNGPVQ